MADDTKSLIALLNGITKRTYYGEEEITNEFLKSEIYPDLPDEEFSSLVGKCSSLLKVDTIMWRIYYLHFFSIRPFSEHFFRVYELVCLQIVLNLIHHVFTLKYSFV